MSSPIIFASNQITERRINQVNDFEIEINPPIDARSGRKSISVDEIIYPCTLSSIHPRNRELFKFKFSMTLGNFVYNKASKLFVNSSLNMHHDWVYIPYGHHQLNDLLIFMNKYLDLIGCEINRVMGQKCVITCGKTYHYYSTATFGFDGFTSNKKYKKSTNRLNDADQFNVKIEFNFSSGLKHVLGFTDSDVVFEFKSSNSKSGDVIEYAGLYVMDPSYGLNFMCVTCDEIVPVKMGNEFKERLLVCPIQFAISTLNEGMSISHYPKNCNRYLKPGIIHSMHFQIKDMNDEKLYFNSGKIVIICSIHDHDFSF